MSETRRFVSTVTRGGQVTLPAEVRRLLGVKALDKIVFTVSGDEVRVLPIRHTLASVKGILPPTRTEDFDEMIREAQVEVTRNAYGESV